MQGAHSHGYLTTLRGILKAGVLAGDEELIQFVKERRQEILDKGCVYPNGDISEAFPRVSARNEGCSIADWIMLNLLYAHYFDEDEAYEMVDHSLWNALYFNQFVTGGFGHRYFGKNGYRTYIEEAWWCCTQNSGMALSEVARHVVTMKDGRLKLNFFIPGEYTVPTEKGEMAGISGGEAATAHVQVILPNRKKAEIVFQPLCSATTNLCLMDIVSDFESIEYIL